MIQVIVNEFERCLIVIDDEEGLARKYVEENLIPKIQVELDVVIHTYSISEIEASLDGPVLRDLSKQAYALASHVFDKDEEITQEVLEFIKKNRQ